MSIYARLSELALALPEPAAPLAAFAPFVGSCVEIELIAELA